MDIRSLVQFLQVAKDGSYTKAAANLYLVQPTLSKTIQNLEGELGVKLFQKIGQQIELTDYGERLVEIATPIVNQFRQIPTLIMEDESKNEGEIRIATTPLLGGLYLATIVTRFCARYPNIRLRITEGSTFSVRDDVLHSNCDVGFCILDREVVGHENINSLPLFRKEIIVALPKNNPIVERPSLSMRDLQSEKFNFYASGHAINTQILNRCREEGFQPELNISSSNIVFLLQLSSAGNGITILPGPCAKEEEWPDLCFRPFDPPLPWECGMITKRGSYQPHVVNLFTRFASEEIKTLL